MDSPADIYNAEATKRGWPTKCDPALGFEAPEFAELLATWNNAAQGMIPPRSAFSARLLKPHLPFVTIYERFKSDTGNPRYRVRLMGTAFAQIYGDLTGKIIDESVPAEMIPRYDIALEQVLRSPAPLRFVARVGMNNKSYLTGEYLMAPLAAEDGAVNMVLCRGHFGNGLSGEMRIAAERHVLSH